MRGGITGCAEAPCRGTGSTRGASRSRKARRAGRITSILYQSPCWPGQHIALQSATLMAELDEETTPRAGRAAIVGRPNVGKSTLLNALLGQKLSIATSKPQTTRHKILGVYSESDPPTQIAFLDTPGLHRPRNALGRALVEEAQGAVADVDVVLWLLESPSDKNNFAPSLSHEDEE